MKAGYFLTLAFVVMAVSVHAQKFEFSKSLKQEEVPVLIQQSLQKDFSSLTQKGRWKLRYSEDAATKRVAPELYEYTCKNNGEKVEIFYNPDGTLYYTKGINAPTHGSQP